MYLKMEASFSSEMSVKIPTLKVKNPQKRISIDIEFTISIFGGQNF
jgi:hypothetical protein